LITFDNTKLQIDQNQAPVPVHRSVQISQVITEPELVQKSTELEQALEYGNFTEYCSRKADSADDQHKKYIWYFLKANFEDNPRAELLNLLGYRIEDVNNKLNQYINKNSADSLTNRLSNLNKVSVRDLTLGVVYELYKKFRTPSTPSPRLNRQVRSR
jgi:protein transport protein SEC31